VEKTRSKPPKSVSRAIELPKNENNLTYRAQDAVPEFVNSPVLAISTAPKESLEKKPGKKIIQSINMRVEFRIKDELNEELRKTLTP